MPQAPVVSGDGTEIAVAVTEDLPSNSLTQTISSLVSGQYSDGGADAGAFTGVVVVDNGSTAGTGQWQYWNGASWINIGTASEASGQYFSASTPIRFSPAANYNGPAPSLTVVLADDTVGAPANGADIDVTTRGGVTPYSTGTVVISQPDITAVNDAPTVIGGTTTTLLAVNEDATNPAGATVDSLFGSHFADTADAVAGGSSANVFSGIMIGINNSNASQGVWQVFTGGAWIDLAALSPTNTYLISASDSLRFVPAADYNGTPGGLVVLLIDDSAGAVVTGTRLDSSVTGSGGTTPYSNSTMTLGTSITSVNDAPAVVSGDAVTYTEGGAAVVVSPALTLSDPDHANAAGATVTVTDFVAGDVLTFTDQNGITGVYDSGTGILTLSGSASLANYQAALRSITYSGAADANVGGTDNTRTIDFVVTDGTDPSASTTATITINDGGGPTAGPDNLSGTAGDDHINGLAGDDTIDGGDGNDYLKGGLGADHMLGGTGDDTYVVDDAGDTPDETGGSGVDLVWSGISWTLGTDLENLTLGSAGNLDGTGNALDNVITGNSFDNTLTGLDGADTLSGGGGKDHLYGGDGIDNLDGGSQDDLLDGGDGDDVLIGGAGADYMRGGAGADGMAGGTGDDFYAVDDVGDAVFELAGQGTDTVQSRISYTLGANVENLTLGSAGRAIDGTGNDLANVLTGNNFANVLSGLDGADTLIGSGGTDTLIGGNGDDQLDGGSQDDILMGGAGYDSLTGGAGLDSFVFTDADIHLTSLGGTSDKDRILDLSFAGRDHIDLSGIDADTATGGDQALTFVSAFTHVAGQAVMTFAGGITTLKIDVDGDGASDLRIEINGDVTGTAANLYTGAGDTDGGWVL